MDPRAAEILSVIKKMQNKWARAPRIYYPASNIQKKCRTNGPARRGINNDR